MGKSEEIRKKQTKIIKRILICTITILVIVAICLIATIVSSNKEKEDNLEADASKILEQDTRAEAKLRYGADMDTFEELNKVVSTYLNYFEDGDYDLMWLKWDESLLKYYGYSYDEESFSKEYRKFRDQLHAGKDDPQHISTGYSAATYFDYGQYYLFVFRWIHSYYDDTGKVVNVTDEYTYTITKNVYGDNTYYSILDFNIQDIGTQEGRFVNLKAKDNNSGVEVSPGIYVPDAAQSSTKSDYH